MKRHWSVYEVKFGKPKELKRKYSVIHINNINKFKVKKKTVIILKIQILLDRSQFELF